MDARLKNEIMHGRKIAAHAGETWNWETPAGRLRWQRRVRMLSSELRPEMRVLEIGCGTGYLTRELVHTGAIITAIDISPDLLEKAQGEIVAGNVAFLCQNAYDLNFEESSFDAVVGSSVLHHLEVNEAISEIYRVLAPGGAVRFTEPNMLNPQIAAQKNIPAIKRALGDSPDETAFFRWGVSKRLRRAGFTSIAVEPFDFLHPQIPGRLVGPLVSFCHLLERLPLVREIAGSLYICAKKPADGPQPTSGG